PRRPRSGRSRGRASGGGSRDWPPGTVGAGCWRRRGRLVVEERSYPLIAVRACSMLNKFYGALSQLALARSMPVSLGRTAVGTSLHRRSLYILPTREGLYYGFMLAVMLVAAVNYANGLAYALTFLLAALGMVAILHTHRNLPGLRLSAGPAPPVFAGAPARFTVIAHNDSGLARLAVDIALGGQTGRVDVPGQGIAVHEFTVPSRVRGYLQAPPVRLSTRFP